MSRDIKSIEKTFVMIKPDGVARGLIGDIFERFERIGLKLVSARLIKASQEQAKGNYPGDDKDWIHNLGNKTYRSYEGDEEAIKQDLGTTDKMEIGEKVYNSLVTFIMESPVLISVWEGNHAVQTVRKLVGSTMPAEADVGSIRGDYGFDSPQLAVKSGRIVFKNVIHCSESEEESKREIAHWFGDNYKDLGDYERVDYIGMFDSY
jgi:nucleoside-diphosphate kinase